MLNLLAATADVLAVEEPLGALNGIIYALIGLVIVFLGILLLILIFTGLGAIMKKVNIRKQAKQEAKHGASTISVPLLEVEEGISPEIVAAITAALAVYTDGEQQKCDFVVRKIRRV